MSHRNTRISAQVERLEDRALLTAAAFFSGLGDLPGGFGSTADGISDDGQTIVGKSCVEDCVFQSRQAVRWTFDSSGTPLAEPLLPDATMSRAQSASADGSVIVGHRNDVDSESFRWIDGQMLAIPDLPGDNGDGNGVARSVSSDGTVIAGRVRSDDGDQAYVWMQDPSDPAAPGQTIGLGDLPGGSFDSAALAVSGDGSTVVGWGTNSDDMGQAIRWVQGDTEMTPLLDFELGSSAWDVSSDGSVVVGIAGVYEETVRVKGVPGQKYQTRTVSQGFRWTEANGMIPLGSLPGGIDNSFAHAVSADGSVIAGHSYGADGIAAFIWDESDQMRSLQDVLVTNFGLDLTGWDLHHVYGMTPDGLTFVGDGRNPDGNFEAFIARLPAPEPGITVSPNIGLQTSEDGTTDVIDVVLDAEPTADVTIIVSSSDVAEGQVVGATGGVLTLTFTDTNWNTPQQVTIQGVEDAGEQDGSQPYSIQFDPSTSADPAYAALTSVEVTATNLDNDAPAPSNTIYVYDILDTLDTRTRGRNNTDHRIVIDVRQDDNGIAEASDAGIGGVQVTVELRDSGGSLVGTYTGTTDSNGLFYSSWIKNLGPGDYRAEVTDLVLAGYDWDLLGLDPTLLDDDDDGDSKPDQLLSV